MSGKQKFIKLFKGYIQMILRQLFFLNSLIKVIFNGVCCNKVLRYHRNTSAMLSHLKACHKHLNLDEPLQTPMKFKVIIY